jgi:DNA-damage-inducible protein J
MIPVRVDEKIKSRAAKVLGDMGLSVSDAVRALLTRIATEKRLPFEITVTTAETRASMAEAEKIMGRYRNTLRTLAE